jgi:hypothetical protein
MMPYFFRQCQGDIVGIRSQEYDFGDWLAYN